MSPHRLTLGTLLLAALAVAPACGDEKQTFSTSSGTPPLATGVGGSGGDGGDGGGGTTPIICGNGVLNDGEDCDRKALGGLTCASFNYASGELACADDCTFDVSGCADVESCIDGLDNDKDGALDCADSECAAACTSACTGAAVVTLVDASTIAATTTGHPNTLVSACSAPAGSGPDLVFAVKAAHGGVLEATLTSDANLGLSARSTCAGAELACSDRAAGPAAIERVEIPVVAGETVYLAVQGFTAADDGFFLLDARSRAITCGDGHTDGAEACDDGGTAGGDGCSASCQVESTEAEPNDTIAAANPLAAPWYAAITPAGDVDVVKVVVASAPSTLTATIGDFDGASCASGEVDPQLELVDEDGAAVIAAAFSEGGACPKLTASNLAAGIYHLRVAASPFAPSQTFAYALDVSVVHDVCGDGAAGGSEQCDDGNTQNGDGCSAQCRFEPTESEPNDGIANANAITSPWHAAITDGDVDVVKIDVPGPKSTLYAQVIDHGTGDCAAAKIVSHVEILDDAAKVLAASDGIPGNYCGAAAASDLDAGTYYVRVTAGPLADPSAQTFSYGLSLTVQ